MAPVLINTILLKILVVVLVVNLACVVRILPLIKVHRLVLYLICLTILPDCSLLIFKSILFGCSKLKVTVLNSPLVGSKTSIGGRQLANHLFRQIIHLYTMVAHSVHKVRVGGIRVLSPHEFSLASGLINKEYFLGPLALNRIGYLPRTAIDSAVNSILIIFGSCPPCEFNLRILLSLFNVFYKCTGRRVQVNLPEDDIVNTEVWRNQFKQFIIRFQFDVFFVHI